jgi:hypothetical protein
MFGERGEEHIPTFIAYGSRLGPDESGLYVGRLPSIFFQELPDQLPTDLVILGSNQMTGEAGQGHGLVLVSHTQSISAATGSAVIVIADGSERCPNPNILFFFVDSTLTH